MIISFYISLALLFYTFLGYPLILYITTCFHRNPSKKGFYEPRITFIVATYNEEDVIAEKIENIHKLNYPKNKLEVVIFSDGSTDDTDEIVRDHSSESLRLLRVDGRKGKTFCQNKAVEDAKGEVLVFSDANSMYDKDALLELVHNFFDPTIGAVCGELRYLRGGSSQEGAYWKFEKFLKKKESLLDSCLGANGAIYAVRKELYTPLPDDAQSDFIEPFMVYRQGFRVVYDEKAFCYEEVSTNEDEFFRKQRIILRALQGMRYIKEFLNPFRYGWYTITLWSHKVIRWMSPLFMILLLLSSMALCDHMFFGAALILQLICYVCAFLGMLLPFKIFRLPYYLVLMQLASLVAISDFVLGRKKVVWESRKD